MIKSVALAALATLAISGAQAASTGDWRCSAPGMASGTYDGGSHAYIHLSAYPNGGSYAVTRKGKVATGKTKDGTPFRCTAS